MSHELPQSSRSIPLRLPRTRSRASPCTSPSRCADPAGPPSPDHPARLEIAYPAELNRWLPLVKWLLAFPHYIALAFVGFGAFFVAIFGFFAVLFTGRWPRGAFDYMVGTFRWAFRVAAYVHLMTDRYPPFTLQDDPDYPVRLAIDYPEHVRTGARWSSGCWRSRTCSSPRSSTG